MGIKEWFLIFSTYQHLHLFINYYQQINVIIV